MYCSLGSERTFVLKLNSLFCRRLDWQDVKGASYDAFGEQSESRQGVQQVMICNVWIGRLI